MKNPALQSFLEELKDEIVFAQILIRRTSTGFEFCHLKDKDFPAEKLRSVAIEEIRALVQHTSSGAFRPLKSAPNLVSGWILFLKNEEEFEFALNQIYPGALADWFAAQSDSSCATNYREFTNRQTGMYRITTMLSDDSAAKMIRAGCHKKFCLKQRLWSVNGLAIDASQDKSLIPCLEPCAILLEFARKVVRLEQEEKLPQKLSEEEVVAVKKSLQQSSDEIREADFNAPENPRRLQLLLESACAFD